MTEAPVQRRWTSTAPEPVPADQSPFSDFAIPRCEPALILGEYSLNVDDAHHIYIRHHYKLCDYRINYAGRPNGDPSLPLDMIVRNCGQHQATCQGLPSSAVIALP